MPEDRLSRALTTDPAALVGRIRSGDSAAEEELVLLYQQDVIGLLCLRTHDRETARELANDVLFAVVCALRAGRLHDVTKLRAFVRGTVRNVANNYLRSRRSRPFEEPLPPDVAAGDVPDQIVEKERMLTMRRGLESLAQSDREILLMTLVDGLKPRQIAADLGLSSEVVRARKSRALQRLIATARRSDS
jgi:RNA polymerase sigma factor (sigma-70 family)